MSRKISIHASAKEATNWEPKTNTKLNFNPRLREGGDIIIFFKQCIVTNFNPRLREGGDLILLLLFYTLHISIHASAKEATQVYN